MRLLANLVLLSSLTGLVACGFPGNDLTADERKADMSWAFTILEHNYAPAELKKSNFGVEMSQVKADCMTMSESEMSNEDFLALFQKCIHTFKDAHLGAQQLNNGLLPENANVAHLGFVTMRTKVDVNGTMTEALKVMAQLKGSEIPWAPVLPGDLILMADGLPVDQVMKAEIIPYINVGQDETNLSLAAFRFAVRTSIDMALPVAEDITLTVKRGDEVSDITIPWIKEDLLSFQTEQQPPEEEGAMPADAPVDGEVVAQKVFANNPLAQTFFSYGSLKEIFGALQSPLSYVSNRIEMIAKTGFRMARFNPLMNALFNGELDKEGDFKLKLMSRILPMAGSVDDLMENPLIPAKIVTTDDGKTYAYIQLASFPSEDEFLLEWNRAIIAIEDKGVKSVIIDMLDNGGGSLLHGMRMLNMVRKDVPLQLPSMQVKLNNNWMNSFKTQAAFGPDKQIKQLAKRTVEKLEADKAAGKSISSPLSLSVLDPFFLQYTGYGMASDVKIALLVNEFCISMCDIFASVFQENNMGVIVGQTTMGGGGNVTQHGVSPVSKMGMAVTESLILSPSGKYIEDNGVDADIEVDMVLDREKGFPNAFNKAYLYVTDQMNVEPAAN